MGEEMAVLGAGTGTEGRRVALALSVTFSPLPTPEAKRPSRRLPCPPRPSLHRRCCESPTCVEASARLLAPSSLSPTPSRAVSRLPPSPWLRGSSSVPQSAGVEQGRRLSPRSSCCTGFFENQLLPARCGFQAQLLTWKAHLERRQDENQETGPQAYQGGLSCLASLSKHGSTYRCVGHDR